MRTATATRTTGDETMHKFSYAVQIQPQTGQQLTECVGGCQLDSPRRLTAAEERANPQASRQAWDGAVAVITAQREVYLIPEEEL